MVKRILGIFCERGKSLNTCAGGVCSGWLQTDRERDRERDRIRSMS